jgi:hypothetical protein
MADWDFDDEWGPRPAWREAAVTGWRTHPVIEVINLLAVALMEILGPFCWISLIVFFLVAEFSSR